MSETRSKPVNILFTPADHAYLKEVCNLLQMPLATFVSKAAVRQAKVAKDNFLATGGKMQDAHASDAHSPVATMQAVEPSDYDTGIEDADEIYNSFGEIIGLKSQRNQGVTPESNNVDMVTLDKR